MYFPVFGFGHLALSRAYKVEFIDENGVWQEIIRISSYVNKKEEKGINLCFSENFDVFIDELMEFESSLMFASNLDARIYGNELINSYISKQYADEVEL